MIEKMIEEITETKDIKKEPIPEKTDEPDSTSEKKPSENISKNPILDVVLKNLMNSGVMDKISSDIFTDKVQLPIPTNNDVDDDEQELDLDLYLLDDQGGNISENLNIVNTTLENINKNLESLTDSINSVAIAIRDR
jgi:hypothetical protein